MTKVKRGKAKFWCHQCGMVAFRNPADAEAKAREVGKGIEVCPAGWGGWHVK